MHRLSLWALGQCSGAHYFRGGPTTLGGPLFMFNQKGPKLQRKLHFPRATGGLILPLGGPNRAWPQGPTLPKSGPGVQICLSFNK